MSVDVSGKWFCALCEASLGALIVSHIIPTLNFIISNDMKRVQTLWYFSTETFPWLPPTTNIA